MEPGILQIDRIRAKHQPRRIGRRIEYFESVSSTNDTAWEQVGAHGDEDTDGLVVFAEHQSAGRGRFGRRWESPRGASLLCSIALIEREKHWTGGELALLAAVAAYDAIASRTAVVPTIKWPNDLLVGKRKLGGMLVESRVLDERIPAYVLGIGINCLQQRAHLSNELARTATSLEMESSGPVDRTAVAISLLAELDRRLESPRRSSYADLRGKWLARAEPLGSRVHLRHAGKVYSGSMIDLDPTAALVVRLDDGGVRAFNAADTTIVNRGSDAGD